MKLLKCVLILLGVHFCLTSCLSPEEKRARAEARAKAEAERIAAREKAEAERREYYRELDSSTIDDLTTCKHGSLEKIRKNLILMGYEIETLDDQVLVTKWHQSSNDGGFYYHKLSFVKVAPNRIKFKERDKHEYTVTEQDKQVSTVKDGSYEQRLENQRYACSKDPNSDECQKKVLRKDTTSETVSYRNVTKVDEYDPKSKYYARDLEGFKSYRDKICGPEPVASVKKTTTNTKKNATK